MKYSHITWVSFHFDKETGLSSETKTKPAPFSNTHNRLKIGQTADLGKSRDTIMYKNKQWQNVNRVKGSLSALYASLIESEQSKQVEFVIIDPSSHDHKLVPVTCRVRRLQSRWWQGEETDHWRLSINANRAGWHLPPTQDMLSDTPVLQ